MRRQNRLLLLLLHLLCLLLLLLLLLLHVQLRLLGRGVQDNHLASVVEARLLRRLLRLCVRRALGPTGGSGARQRGESP
jgi:hypothetical protein